MPIYEYKCTACNHTFSKLIQNAQQLPELCPQCQQPTLKKLFSTFSATSTSSRDACPAASTCPSGGCCAAQGGGCPARA